jgi:hypothetical protein
MVCRIHTNQLSYEPEAPSGNSFYEARIRGLVIQSPPEFVDCNRKTSIQIVGSIRAPNFLKELLSSNEFSGTRQKKCKNLKRLLLQPDASTAIAKLGASQIEFESCEPYDGLGQWRHCAGIRWRYGKRLPGSLHRF